MKAIRMVVVLASFLLVLGLTLSSQAAREVISGSVEKVDPIKGQVSIKTQAGMRDFVLRTPEKLKDLQQGDKVEFTIQEDGSAVIVENPEKKK